MYGKLGGYTGEDRMCDLVCDKYFVLQVMSRFGIALGFGDKSIAEVCAASGVDTDTFLAVVNLLVEKADPETLAEKLARSQQKSRKPAAAAKAKKTGKGEKKANGRTADGKRKTVKKSTEAAAGSKTGKVSREKEAAPARGRGKNR